MTNSSICHGSNVDYQQCLMVTFNEGSPIHEDTTADYSYVIIGIAITITIAACGWMILSIYNSWANGGMNFQTLLIRAVRVIIILSILVFLLAP